MYFCWSLLSIHYSCNWCWFYGIYVIYTDALSLVFWYICVSMVFLLSVYCIHLCYIYLKLSIHIYRMSDYLMLCMLNYLCLSLLSLFINVYQCLHYLGGLYLMMFINVLSSWWVLLDCSVAAFVQWFYCVFHVWLQRPVPFVRLIIR